MVEKVTIVENHNPRWRHRATGVQLANGTSIQAKEVILSAGAIRTPQLLMLSGLGPEPELKKHDIPLILDIPDVGQNLADHPLFPNVWKIKDPSKGYAIGSNNPLFKQPQYGWGVPTDFLVSTGIDDKEGLAKAIEEDEGKKPDPSTHPLLKRERTFNEHVLQYAGAPDGSAVVTALITLLPTSRGSVTLASSNVNDAPLINPNYRGTAVDRFVAREGMRLQIKLTSSNHTILGREILDGDAGAPGFDKPFTVDSTDEYIDKRIVAGVGSTYHPMGTAAMGKVVDTNLRVPGVAGLRVVDTSVFPVVITGHLQVATYAMAERAAEIIYLQRKCQN
ncbi:hypothetical protein Golomagni_07265 [Golovinomyces magnicellulatus]|nr:hypothetical protein Golomagni_07265 [Golovinomyces magnicellulatus]